MMPWSSLGNRFLYSAGAMQLGEVVVPNSSPVLDRDLAPMLSRNFIQYWGWGLEEGS